MSIKNHSNDILLSFTSFAPMATKQNASKENSYRKNIIANVLRQSIFTNAKYFNLNLK